MFTISLCVIALNMCVCVSVYTNTWKPFKYTSVKEQLKTYFSRVSHFRDHQPVTDTVEKETICIPQFLEDNVAGTEYVFKRYLINKFFYVSSFIQHIQSIIKMYWFYFLNISQIHFFSTTRNGVCLFISHLNYRVSSYFGVSAPTLQNRVEEATVRTGHGTTDWFQIGKGVRQGCILSPAYLTYMQSTSCEILGWMKHKLESRLPGEISITSDMQIVSPLWQKVKKN